MPKLPDELRVNLIVIANEQGIPVRGKHPIEIILQLKGITLQKEDEEVLKKICKLLKVEYNRVRGIK